MYKGHFGQTFGIKINKSNHKSTIDITFEWQEKKKKNEQLIFIKQCLKGMLIKNKLFFVDLVFYFACKKPTKDLLFI